MNKMNKKNKKIWTVSFNDEVLAAFKYKDDATSFLWWLKIHNARGVVARDTIRIELKFYDEVFL